MKRLIIGVVEMIAGALLGQLALRFAIGYATNIDVALRKFEIVEP